MTYNKCSNKQALTIVLFIAGVLAGCGGPNEFVPARWANDANLPGWSGFFKAGTFSYPRSAEEVLVCHSRGHSSCRRKLNGDFPYVLHMRPTGEFRIAWTYAAGPQRGKLGNCVGRLIELPKSQMQFNHVPSFSTRISVDCKLITDSGEKVTTTESASLGFEWFNNHPRWRISIRDRRELNASEILRMPVTADELALDDSVRVRFLDSLRTK